MVERNPADAATPPGHLGHGIRAGLMAGALVYAAEALYLLAANGAFLALQMTPTATLARYAVAGALAGLLFALLSGLIHRLLPRVNAWALTTALLLAFAFLAETGFYLFDIARPWGELSSAEKWGLAALLLGADCVLLLVAYFVDGRFTSHRCRGTALSLTRFSAAYVAACVMLIMVVAGVPRFRGGGGRLEGGKDARPDIILIVLDTVRADALSCYGNPLGTTPNLDRIAAEGRRYEKAISPAAWTPPAHASLFTGLYPSAHGTQGLNTILDGSLGVLAEWVGKAGYRSLTLYNNPLAGTLNRMDRGFDYSIGVETDRKVSFLDGRIRSKYLEHDSGVIRTTRLIRAWMEYNRMQGVPGFLFVNLNDAHLPYEPRAPWFERYRGALVPPGTAVDQAIVNRANSESGVIGFRNGEFDIGEAEFETLRAAYYSELTEIDCYLGGGLLEMRRDGLLDDALVIITADHGEALGEGGHLGHANGLYDPVIRIPLIIWWPGVVPPGVDRHWASLVDIAPTLLDLPGIRDGVLRGGLHGRDLLEPGRAPFIVSEHVSLDTAAVHEYLVLAEDFQMRVASDGSRQIRRAADRAALPEGDEPPAGTPVPPLPEFFESWRDACRASRVGLTSRAPGDSSRQGIRDHLRSLGYIN